MKKTIVEIYALAVCFITVICATITVMIALYSVIGILCPRFTLYSYQYESYQSNEQFCLKNADKFCAKKTANEITQLRETQFAAALKGERRMEAQTLVKTLIVLFICLFAFIPHWLLAKRARQKQRLTLK